MARHYGLRKLAVPSAGNAAGALAAYAAAAGIEAHIFMPRDVPFANYVEAAAYGANVTLVDGLISDCGRMVAERRQIRRLVRYLHAQRTIPRRRKKDDGLRAGRTARLGISRRCFLSHRRRRRPDRHVESVRRTRRTRLGQTGQAPAHDRRAVLGLRPGGASIRRRRNASEMWHNAATFASGLRVPKPYGDSIMLEILRESDGRAVAIPDEKILASLKTGRGTKAIFLSPEGAAATAAYDHLPPPASSPPAIASSCSTPGLGPQVHRRNSRSHAPGTPRRRLACDVVVEFVAVAFRCVPLT